MSSRKHLVPSRESAIRRSKLIAAPPPWVDVHPAPSGLGPVLEGLDAGEGAAILLARELRWRRATLEKENNRMPTKKKSSGAENGARGRAKQIGRYIVADPKICHGALTFRGTRIFVSQVLDMVAQEIPWDRIIWEWRGSVPREAIAEAIYLARGALLKGTPEDEVAVERSRKAS